MSLNVGVPDYPQIGVRVWQIGYALLFQSKKLSSILSTRSSRCFEKVSMRLTISHYRNSQVYMVTNPSSQGWDQPGKSVDHLLNYPCHITAIFSLSPIGRGIRLLSGEFQVRILERELNFQRKIINDKKLI